LIYVCVNYSESMKVIEHINQAKDLLVSFEILPPLKGKMINSIYDHLDPLMEFKPSFINVTYHRSETMFKKKADSTFEKVEVRKRHLNFLGIDNVLALRGDAAINETSFEPEKNGNLYALDLLKQVVNLNHGIYVEEDIKNGSKTNFCIGVAGYPEKHFEAPNMTSDLSYLKAKVDAGAEYITTQMFFDNRKYFEFVKSCRETGIEVPVIPGLKPITNKKQLTLLPKVFHVDIPADLSDAIMKCRNDEEVEKCGTEWLLEQSRELKKSKVPVLHYYTLGKPKVIWNVVKELI
jgi:methylenetetrahydrofolate reductase (NADPH)